MQTVRVGRDIVRRAIETAPRSILATAGARGRDFDFKVGNLAFLADYGAPNVTDLDCGRSAGRLEDFKG